MTNAPLPTKYMSTFEGNPVEVIDYEDYQEVKDPQTRQTLRLSPDELETVIENIEA